MKKLKLIPAIFMMAVMLITLSACGNSSVENATSNQNMDTTQTAETEISDQTEIENKVSEATGTTGALSGEETTPDTVEETDTALDSNILVVYFSRTGEQYGVGVIDEGNTAIVAKMIIDATGADSFEILPADDYYPMTYDELTDVAKREQNENARPTYAGEVPDLSQYDTIFIGAPVWWGDWPMICYTFFENENLSEKTLYPFSTHAGSGLSGFDRKLSSAVPDATVGEGLAIAGTECQNDKDGVRSKVENWLSGLEY